MVSSKGKLFQLSIHFSSPVRLGADIDEYIATK